jgi:cell division protein FtsL
MNIPKVEVRGTTRGNNTVGRAQDRLRAARTRLTMQASRIRLAWRFMLIAILVCLGSIIWLSQTSAIVSLGYETENLEKQKVVLDRQATQLQAQVAQYEDLQRVQEEATKMGMVTPKSKVYVTVTGSVSQPAPETSSNSQLAPVNDWWRELTEMLPRPFRGSVPANPGQAQTSK